ncbi:TPA: hypothetical protein N0F65_005128 [Lagenidium giganteum]|uniref:Rhodanese domain-containing protein n=1 Tax=Lagenidium giganteum TaxID=4803 RepID=A0AAV2YSR2_9STRA|nr:TPA: hypothetical protein N0F65_005128 [Lagenidium giganteum]
MATLEQRMAALERENARLRAQLHALGGNPPAPSSAPVAFASDSNIAAHNNAYSPLSAIEIQRYGRQMLVKDFGAAAQRRLQTSRALVVGAGGLGCPVAMYLSAMGVGTIGLVDADTVERSNLHRQVLHGEDTIGMLKVESARQLLQQLNPHARIETAVMRVTAANAEEIVAKYDVVVDATDNPATRYVLNGACITQRKALVSGSALGMEGQLTVFAFDGRGADDTRPCYQCVYPRPPKAPQSCAENGVLGVVPGIIGSLQAVEAVKALTGVGQLLDGTQCLYDAYDGRVRQLKLGQRRADCPACQPATHCERQSLPQLMAALGASEDEQAQSCACGDVQNEAPLPAEHEVDAVALAQARRRTPSQDKSFVLLDVRARHQFDIVHFPEAINVPLRELTANKTPLVEQWKQQQQRVVVVCRRGVDSVTATKWLLAQGMCNVQNVTGGYTEFARAVPDEQFPMY